MAEETTPVIKKINLALERAQVTSRCSASKECFIMTSNNKDAPLTEEEKTMIREYCESRGLPLPIKFDDDE